MLPPQVLRLSPPKLCLVSSVSPLLHPCVSYAQVSVLCYTFVSHLRLCREFHGCVLSRPLPLGRHVLSSHVLLQPYCASNIRVTHTALSSTGRRCSAEHFTSVDFCFCFWMCLCPLCFALCLLGTAVCGSPKALQGLWRGH